MKTRGKVLLLIVSAMALVIASIFGTLAYLTDTEAVTNTFTVGHVDITLDEADVNEYGKPVNEENEEVTDLKDAKRVQSNEYHLVPGHVYTKDPTVTVKAGSEKSYVRIIIKVKNIDKLESALPDTIKDDSNVVKYYADLNNDGYADDFVLEKLLNETWNYEKWDFIEGSYKEETAYDGIITGTYEFRYVDIVGEWGGLDADVRLDPLFTEIKIPGADIDNARIAYLEDVVVTVVAHAIQVDGFENNVNAAWEAFGTGAQFGDSITQTTTAVTP